MSSHLFKNNSRGKGGPLQRGRKGKTVTAVTRRAAQNKESMDFSDEDGGVLGNSAHFVGMSNSLSDDINNMRSPQPIRVGEKGRSGARRNHKKKFNEPNPLTVAQERQSMQAKHPGQSMNSQSTCTGTVPRKSNKERHPNQSLLGGKRTNGTSRAHQDNNNAHSRDATRPTSSIGTRSSTARGTFSQVTNGIRRRHQKSPEFVDLCGDDDDDDHKQQDEGYERSEDNMSRSTASSRGSRSSRRTESSSPDSSEESSRAKGETTSGSSTTGTPADTSAATSATLSSNGREQDSSDESVSAVQPRRKSVTRFRAPDDNGTILAVAGTSDLLPLHESEGEESEYDICQRLEDIRDVPYNGSVSSTRAKKPLFKKQKKSSATTGKKTPTKTKSDAMPSSNFAWGSTAMPKQREASIALRVPKVNASKPKNNRKRKATAIQIGAAIHQVATRRSPEDDDPIQDCESSNDGNWGVQRNRYATDARTYSARKAKSKRSERKMVDHGSDNDYDETALAQLGGTRETKRKVVNVVRIAIGKKVFSKECKIRFFRSPSQGKIVLYYADANGSRLTHEINLDDESVKEIKYCIAGDDDDPSKLPIAIDFDESEQMTFLAMQVTPDDSNKLLTYPNAYMPSPTKRSSDEAVNKQYIAIEFRSDAEFLELLKVVKKDETLRAFVSNSSQLKPAEAEKYGMTLLQAARKERAARERSLGSPRIRRTRKKKCGFKPSNEVMLVFPFGADEDDIDKAAEGLNEAGIMDTVETNSDKDTRDTTVLKTSEGEGVANSSSDDAAAADDDDPAEMTKSRAHFLTIRDEDYDRLQPGEFLNDTLIDFWFQWIWRKEQHSGSDVHFFTSHFYTALAKGGPKAVTSWTAKKNIDIFTEKLIFIPINQSLHWSLCVVVNPGAILNEVVDYSNEIPDDDELFPCIFFFDSLKAHRKQTITANVRKWLNSEWQRLEKAKAENAEDAVAPFNANTMRVYDPRVPYQDNSWDCGVFVCRYGYGIYRLRGRNVTYSDRGDKFQSLITSNEEFAFNRDDIVRIRRELATLVDNLSVLYKEWKKINDGSKKKAEPKKRTARRLLTETGDASANTEEVRVASMTEQDQISARSTEAPMSKVEQTNKTTPTALDSTATEAETTFLDSMPPKTETADVSSNKSMDVERVEANQAAMSIGPENSATPGTAESDADMMDADKEGCESGIESTVMDEETELVDENSMPAAAESMQGETSAPVKQEEDQYGVDAMVLDQAQDNDENMEEAQYVRGLLGNDQVSDKSNDYDVTDI